MKGYTNVSVVDIESAIKVWKEKFDQGKVIRDKGIELYYNKFYHSSGFLTRWFNRNKTPYEFALKRVGMFYSWDNILDTVLDEDELDILEMWQYSRHKESYVAVKSLMGASESGDILLDNDLCWFVNKYKGDKSE